MANKFRNYGFDWDGVASEGIFEDGAYIITGEPASENESILETLGDKKPSKILNYPYDDLEDENGRDIKIAIWKAKTLKALGIEKYYEDTEDIIQVVKELSPKTEVVKVVDGVPQEKLNFIIFTYEGFIFPVAEKLEKEGNRVIVGVIQDGNDTLLPDEKKSTEDKEKKEKRLSNYDGIIDKYSAEEVLKIMKKIKDKENWIVLTDSNENFKFTEKALEMGFTKGMFPTQEDRSMEVDRKKAKDFVKENYPDIEVATVKTFKTIEEGITFLNEEKEELWVLKSLGDLGETIVPDNDDPEMAKLQLISALEEMKKDYESHGFLLEQKIQEVIELTPEVYFWDGLPIAFSMDIENKCIGAGNIGVQTGCMQNLIVQTEAEDRINKIAFPEIIHEMAKKRKGLFVWDLSILVDKKGRLFFGEYCSQRFGWDSFPTELAMCSDNENSKVVTPFFSALLYKKNPFRKKFAVGVRILNIGPCGRMCNEGNIDICPEAVPCTWLYKAKIDKKSGKCVSVTDGWDFAVVTGASDELHEAIEQAYEYVDMVLFEGKYFRTKEDFQSYQYSSAILNRLNYAQNHGLITTEDGGLVSPSSGRD